MKNERGLISLFVLLSALFFLVVVTSVGISFKNKEAKIDTELEKIKESYEKDIGNEEQIYFGKISRENSSIIDYDVDLKIDVDGNSKYDWQYFYNDGKNIYIIAEDYIPINSSLLSNSLGNIKTNIVSHPYSFNYDMSENGDDTVLNIGKTGSEDLFGNNVSDSNKFIPDKYLVKWKEKVQNSPTTANNAKIVAMMMDTAKWGNFANSTKIKTTLNTSKPEELLATGGPTLEMWIKSWNEKHGNLSDDENKIEIEYNCSNNGIGYLVRSEGGEWNYGINLSGNSNGVEDKMYFPHTSNYNECYGYWLISPSAQGYNSIIDIGYDGEMSIAGCGNWSFGIRPVVCLPSDITAEWNEEKNIWELKKKEIIIADRTGISVGDYITYTSPTASVSLSTIETGYTEEQTLTRKDTFRVMQINDDGSMVLMGAMTAQDDNIYFNGGLGYNNGVYTLNTKCNELYKDDTRGITARSIKIEDITGKFNDYANSKITDCLDDNFGDLSVENQISSLNEENRTATYENSAYSFATYYPDIIRYEEGCAIDNVPTQGIIGESDIYSGYNYNGKTGLTNLGMVSTYPTSLTLPYTYYDIDGEYRDFADTENAGAFNNMFYGTGTKYYLASRCIGLTPPFAYFNLRTINGNGIDASLMRTSDNEDYGSPSSGKVCPIVYIPSDVEIDISENPKNQLHVEGTAHLVK